MSQSHLYRPRVLLITVQLYWLKISVIHNYPNSMNLFKKMPQKYHWRNYNYHSTVLHCCRVRCSFNLKPVPSNISKRRFILTLFFGTWSVLPLWQIALFGEFISLKVSLLASPMFGKLFPNAWLCLEVYIWFSIVRKTYSGNNNRFLFGLRNVSATESNVLATERRRCICNVFSHWLRACSAIDRKPTQTEATDSVDINQCVPWKKVTFCRIAFRYHCTNVYLYLEFRTQSQYQFLTLMLHWYQQIRLNHVTGLWRAIQPHHYF